MSQTKIYTSRKLEKVIKEFISEENNIDNNYLGDWNATLFYVSHKKCWLLINNLTKYILILPNVKKSDHKKISSIFKRTFFDQLTYDGIKVEHSFVEKIIGEIKLCETNNNQSANGFLNNNLYYFDEWKYEFDNFENMNFRDLNGRLNSSPVKILNWMFPKEKMYELISEFQQ